ncbi:hypothetical protein BT96DRAFT_178689 [Gymnopus androsaceus JB14]|uniref:Fungal pheromone STE3G-protein-coupled receptor n=1 Tax=Gymnopus androsaceus JB14 TaxID=1447944 RepID=A0A6A4H937_9AGAR|nr:hypothetical protein BT96DRAFT_178689 [Gymnopus androsaceus JB14]
MTPEEQSALREIGLTIHENLLVAIFMSFFYGMYLLIFPIAVTTLLRNGILKGVNNRASLSMFILTLLTFLSTTLFWTMYIAEYTATVRLNLYSNFDVSIVDRAAVASRQAIRFAMVILWPQLINFMVGDAIVVWRVWVLYSERKYVRISLVVLWVLTCLSYTAYTGWRQHLMIINGTGAFDTIAENLQVICFSMSCGTNIIGTCLIGLKAWEFRRYIRMNTGGKGKSTVIQRCLDLMTETGILYCILQFTFLMLNSIQSSNNEPSGGAMDIATHLMIEAAIVIGAIYPILTVILVSQSRSIAATPHAREPGSTGSSANDPSIQFGTNSITTVDFRTNDSYSGTNLFHMSVNSSKV